jgi:hypothetical protein
MKKLHFKECNTESQEPGSTLRSVVLMNVVAPNIKSYKNAHDVQ